ncbi:MAG: hypothetical protein ACYSUN_16840 [Planctomycetota bacterium]|jgi:hypothetical protein
MADVVITFTIPDAKVAEALPAFLVIHPNITSDPTQWSDPPLTDGQWVKYRIRQWVNEQVNEGRRHLHHVNNPEPIDGEFAEE